MKMNSRGQIWIETVIYILIGLVLIALVLAFVVPKINEQRDRIMVEQTIVSLSILDDKINEVIDNGKNNKRIVEYTMRTGELYFNSIDNEINFILSDLTKPYSEPGIKIPVGRIIVESTEGKKTSSVNLTLQYPAGIDLKFDNQEIIKKIDPSVTPYSFSIENKGIEDGRYKIDILRIS